MLVKSLKSFIIKKVGMFLIKLQHFEFFFLENIILGIFRQIPNFEENLRGQKLQHKNLGYNRLPLFHRPVTVCFKRSFKRSITKT